MSVKQYETEAGGILISLAVVNVDNAHARTALYKLRPVPLYFLVLFATGCKMSAVQFFIHFVKAENKH